MYFKLKLKNLCCKVQFRWLLHCRFVDGYIHTIVEPFFSGHCYGGVTVPLKMMLLPLTRLPGLDLKDESPVSRDETLVSRKCCRRHFCRVSWKHWPPLCWLLFRVPLQIALKKSTKFTSAWEIDSKNLPPLHCRWILPSLTATILLFPSFLDPVFF